MSEIKIETFNERPESDYLFGLRNMNPAGIGFLALIAEDFTTHERDLFSQGFWAVAVHRFGNWRMGFRFRLIRIPLSILYKIFDKCIEVFFGISLKYTVHLGRRVRIWHHGGMVLGAVSIGDDVHIRQNTTFGVKRRGDPRWDKPRIESGCDIGAGAVIVGAITVGADSVIGANVVLTKSVPPKSLVYAPKPYVVVRNMSDEIV